MCGLSLSWIANRRRELFSPGRDEGANGGAEDSLHGIARTAAPIAARPRREQQSRREMPEYPQQARHRTRRGASGQRTESSVIRCPLIVIPLLDLGAQYDRIQHELDPAIARVLHSGQYVLGPEVEAFEREFSVFCTSRHAVGVNSGTSALYLALVAAGIGPGDEVITVPYTFEATIAAIRAAGADVALVDVDPAALTMRPDALEQRIGPRTKAIIPVHLFGQPADMDPIIDTAAQHGLTVIEDACQAHGASYKGRRVGSIGDIGCFSFYPSKNLGTAGEGGMIVTDDPELAEQARLLRSWGPVHRSSNYRFSAIEAAILRVKLSHLECWTAERQAVAARYRDLLADIDLQLPRVMPYAEHVFHVYAVRSPARDHLADALRRHGIGSAVHYPEPIHLQEKYKDLGYAAGDFPTAEQAAREELSLPIYPELSDDGVARIAETLGEHVGATQDGSA